MLCPEATTLRGAKEGKKAGDDDEGKVKRGVSGMRECVWRVHAESWRVDEERKKKCCLGNILSLVWKVGCRQVYTEQAYSS